MSSIESIGNLLHEEMSKLWNTSVSVRIINHPYSKKAYVHVAPMVTSGLPGIDYPVLKLTIDLKSQALELRLLEQPEDQFQSEQTFNVLAGLAAQMGDWQLIEAYPC